MARLRAWFAKSLVAPIVVTWVGYALVVRLILYIVKEL